MSAAPLQTYSTSFVLFVMSGPDKGVSYRLVSSKITLGRDSDNDVVLNDQKCSRHHCVLTIQGNQIIAKDLGSKTGISFNGKRFEEAQIQINQTFQVGDTLLCLKFPESEKTSFPTRPDHFPAKGSSSATASQYSSAPTSSNKRPQFYAAIFLIGALLFFVISRSPTKVLKGYGLKTEQEVDEEIKNTQKRKEDIFREKMAQGLFNSQASEAQASYIQGFRDFREGNFGRAIQSFTAALALNPDHQLAQKYKRLAEKKQDELIQYNMLDGKRYYEQNKFELARAAYRNVLIILNDPNNKLFIEAKERLQEVELLLKGRY